MEKWLNDVDLFQNTIPKELKRIHQWCSWKSKDIGNGKKTKIPVQYNGKWCSTTDKNTWNRWNDVKRCQNKGFIFSKEIGITGIDLDDCFDENGRIKKKPKKIIEVMNSYTEFSPSRKGFHIFVFGNLPQIKGNKKNDVEMYDDKRFFTITGDVYQNYDKIERRQTELNILHKVVFRSNYERETTLKQFVQKNRKSPISDEWVLNKLNNSKIREKFESLWNGISRTLFSKSEMDLSLIRMISFYTQDFEQLERIWMNSPLGNRKKTQTRKDYRRRQIDEILNTMGETYNG